MSLKVFVDSNATLEALARDVSALVGVRLDAHDSGYGPAYSGDSGEFALLLSGHDFVNDGDLKFESFRFALDVDADTPELREQSARQVFEMLKPLERPMLLVEDLERRLDEYQPKATPASDAEATAQP